MVTAGLSESRRLTGSSAAAASPTGAPNTGIPALDSGQRARAWHSCRGLRSRRSVPTPKSARRTAREPPRASRLPEHIAWSPSPAFCRSPCRGRTRPRSGERDRKLNGSRERPCDDQHFSSALAMFTLAPCFSKRRWRMAGLHVALRPHRRAARHGRSPRRDGPGHRGIANMRDPALVDCRLPGRSAPRAGRPAQPGSVGNRCAAGEPLVVVAARAAEPPLTFAGAGPPTRLRVQNGRIQV